MPGKRSGHHPGIAGCCSGCAHGFTSVEMTRRGFLAGTALTGLSWSALSAVQDRREQQPARRPLVVKPIFTYPMPQRRPQTSWRNWGGIQTPEDLRQEVARIGDELRKLHGDADFPLDFLPLATIRKSEELKALADVAQADALLVYAAGDGGGDLMAAMNPIVKLNKDAIFFVRHKSGPLYYWYEGIMARFLHQHTDDFAIDGIDHRDVVVDSMDGILWRLRALCGLRNTLGTGIIAVGGAAGWAQPADVIADLTRKKWKLDIKSVSYPDLAELIKAARNDASAMETARQRAAAYLAIPGTTLETDKTFVENAFLLEQVFRAVMEKAGCRAITINNCMGTIMPIAQTTACLALSLLNDAGYLAFCESDFVVIPAGILLGSISGRPPFLNDPTYPHENIITVAHCTAPRRMDGKNPDPARIMTHFESDYGAAPKVEMRVGQRLTNLIPDFAARRYVGFSAEVIENPFLPICRSQIEIRFRCDTDLLARNMPGFHWITGYGDYLREVGYALRKLKIQWECLG